MSKNSEELELIMSMYRSGKISGEQKDELIAALENKSVAAAPDKKKIVFRVIAEDGKCDAAHIVRVLSCTDGVESVAFDERSSLATVIGDYDVDGITEAARAANFRLRVRDIDINYVPDPEPDPEPMRTEPQPTEPEYSAAEAEEEQDSGDEIFDDDFYGEEDDVSSESECDVDDDDKEFDDDDEYENKNDNNEKDDVSVHLDDERTFTEFFKGIGDKLAVVFDKSFKAADSAGKKIADFADNVMTKYDIGTAKRGTVVKSKPERYAVPYAEMQIVAKYVTGDTVKLISGTGLSADALKAESVTKLPQKVSEMFCGLIDSKFTGKYKYIEDGTAFKLSVKPKNK